MAANTNYGQIPADDDDDHNELSVLGDDYMGVPPVEEEDDRTPLTGGVIPADQPDDRKSKGRAPPTRAPKKEPARTAKTTTATTATTTASQPRSQSTRTAAAPATDAASTSTASAAAATGAESSSRSTIDESVWETLRRDLLSVWEKMQLVLWPKYLLGGLIRPINAAREQEQGQAGIGLVVRDLAGRLPEAADMVLQQGPDAKLRDWDLWGPLLFCLLLAFLLSHGAQEAQKSLVFSGVFAIVWVGEAVVTLQIALLGGNISFFQSICVIGYTLFPLVIAALLSALDLSWMVRLPVDIVMVLWSLAAGVSILGGSGVVKNRVGLAVYPLFVFYLGLGCLCFVT